MYSFRRPSCLTDSAPVDAFPDVDAALRDPNGLLAIGGDLGPERLLYGYRRGIFPWYSDEQPILWWSPDPRAVLFPGDLKISRSLRRRLARDEYRVSVDAAFASVVRGCAAPRENQEGTWITDEMVEAYVRLHALGHAHSYECWRGDELVGGLYGVEIGRVFFGESMFSRVSDASKVALVELCRRDYALVDCQLPNQHLARLGAREISRREFVSMLDRWCGPDPASPDSPPRRGRR